MLFSFVALAQNSKIKKGSDSRFEHDSLLQLYNEVYTKRDLERWRIIQFLYSRSYEGLNPLEKRIEYIKEGISILNDLDSVRMVMIAYNSLGNMYWLAGEPEKSIESVYKVADFAKNLKDQIWEANAYTNIAASLKSLKEYKEALLLEKKAIRIYRSKNDSLLLFNLNSNLSETYYYLKSYDSGIWASNMAMTFNTHPENSSYIYVEAFLKGYMALLQAREGNYDSAKTLIEQSSEYLLSYQHFSLNQQSAIVEVELANIFLENGRHNDAISYAQSGFSIGEENGLKEVIRDGSYVLAKAYEAQSQPTKSLFYYKTYFAYRDSIVNVENVKQVESLRANFEISQKQTELDIVEVSRRNQELVSYITGGVLLVIAVLALIVYRSYRQKLALSKELAMINDSKNKLFSIISHDLRGPMAAFSGVGFMIKSAMQADDKSFLEEVATEVDKSSKQLSSLLENLLSWAVQEQDGMTVHQEKINTKEVFTELKDTFESQAKLKNITIETEGVHECEINADRNMTYTIFRNLISNALKFTPENGKILISCGVEGEHVITQVKDTGVGMSQDKVDAIFKFDSKKSTYGTSGEKGLGLGLQLVSEFVEINGGAISVESEEENGTSFIVKLPLPNK